MLLRILIFGLSYATLMLCDRMFNFSAKFPDLARNRMFRFAIYQDILVVINVLRLIILEGYTLRRVAERMCLSGLVARVYVASSVALHAALLLDEPPQRAARLAPAPYLPPALTQDEKELFFL